MSHKFNLSPSQKTQEKNETNIKPKAVTLAVLGSITLAACGTPSGAEKPSETVEQTVYTPAIQETVPAEKQSTEEVGTPESYKFPSGLSPEENAEKLADIYRAWVTAGIETPEEVNDIRNDIVESGQGDILYSSRYVDGLLSYVFNNTAAENAENFSEALFPEGWEDLGPEHKKKYIDMLNYFQIVNSYYISAGVKDLEYYLADKASGLEVSYPDPPKLNETTPENVLQYTSSPETNIRAIPQLPGTMAFDDSTAYLEDESLKVYRFDLPQDVENTDNPYITDSPIGEETVDLAFGITENSEGKMDLVFRMGEISPDMQEIFDNILYNEKYHINVDPNYQPYDDDYARYLEAHKDD